ncbi:hypothetical protein ACP4OV_025071 [Aristida adscensionis]
MDKTTTSTSSSHKPDITKGKAKGARNSYGETVNGGNNGSEGSPSNRYPLRSAPSSGRVLRSASTKSNNTISEPLNDSAYARPAVKKRESGSPEDSPNNSVRVLRSASKNKDEVYSEPRNDSAICEPTANKRKCVNPTKAGSPNSSVRLLRSALKNKDGLCSEPRDDATVGEPAANKRKGVSPLKVGSPNYTVRVLRSATKNKDEACSQPRNDTTADETAANKRKRIGPSNEESPKNTVRVLRSASKNKDEACSQPQNGTTSDKPAPNKRKDAITSKVGSPNNSVRVLCSNSKNKNEACSEPLSIVVHPAVKKRKHVSPLEVGSPVGSSRVLRSTSKSKNETRDDPLKYSTAAQPTARKTKGDRPSKASSPTVSVRVLRSASEKKNDAGTEPLNDSTSAQPAVRKGKGGSQSKKRSPKKDYLKIHQRVRYILNRMNYEQSLIQAYASEGWKGQSSEKIRPEKELERARAEILRCKLRIREAFRNMDSLLSDGRLEESLFDSAGEIYSEDIFCAICGSKDVTLHNDIILCDGACDRGFHQNCLNPPLPTEDIPAGDEGWYCPACVCKIHCIEVLNELQGSKLSIHDSWEKVFPEAASLENGSEQIDASNLLSDDLEHNDCRPLAGGHMMNDNRPAEDKGKVDDLGLPSEDSEDDDFDPAGPDSSEDQKNESSSDESDFTSDSDDFCAEIAKSHGQASVSPLSDAVKSTSRMRTSVADNHSNGGNSKRALEMELEQDLVLPISSRRQVERLDYKELYDEAYGEESSNSSDDEEWSGKENSETDESVRPAKRVSRRASAGPLNNQHTTKSVRLCGSVNQQQTEVLRSNGSSSAARKGHFDPIIRQKLKLHFEKEPYPSRATKESLAQELGLTFIQVDKWFASTRHSSRVAAAKKGKHPGNHSTENNDSTAVDSTVREPNDGVMEKFTVDRLAQIDLNEASKEDIFLSGAESETEASGKEPSYSSDDEEWSGSITPQKELDNVETRSLNPKRGSRRAPTGQQNNEHTQSARLNASVNEQHTEALCSIGSSGTVQKYHFGCIINEKLKVHYEKDPYPTRTTMESLAQELGLTLIQVRSWFSSTRHYSSVAAAKKEKFPGNAAEKNDSTAVDSIHVREPKMTADKNMVPDKLMVQINLDKGNRQDVPISQNADLEQRVATTPTAISIETGPPGYGPGGTQGNGASNTSCEQRGFMTPTSISGEVGPPGYGPGETQGYGASNTSCEQRWVMTPAAVLREVGPPGYWSGETRSNGSSRNASCEQRVFMTPTAVSREVAPPGYRPEETQGSGDSWYTSCEQRVFMTPTAISREVSPPGYGPGETQGNGASRNTSCEQRVVMIRTPISREFGPPGYGPGENPGNSASRDSSCDHPVIRTPTAISGESRPPGFGPGENQHEKSVFRAPTTISSDVGPPGYWPGEIQREKSVVRAPTKMSSEVGPPGYWPGENQGNSASTNVGSSKGRSAEKVELADEARKKAILRELRRMKKFR